MCEFFYCLLPSEKVFVIPGGFLFWKNGFCQSWRILRLYSQGNSVTVRQGRLRLKHQTLTCISSGQHPLNLVWVLDQTLFLFLQSVWKLFDPCSMSEIYSLFSIPKMDILSNLLFLLSWATEIPPSLIFLAIILLQSFLYLSVPTLTPN